MNSISSFCDASIRPAASSSSLRFVRSFTSNAISRACAWCGIIACRNCTSALVYAVRASAIASSGRSERASAPGAPGFTIGACASAPVAAALAAVAKQRKRKPRRGAPLVRLVTIAPPGSCFFWLSMRRRKLEPHAGAARQRLELDAAAVQLENPPHDLQAQTRAGPASAARRPEQRLADFGRNAGTVVAHRDLDGVAGLAQRDDDLAARRRVLNRVADQVRQHAVDQAQRPDHVRQARRNVGRKPLLLRGREQPELLHDVVHEVAESERLALERRSVVLQPRELEQLVRELRDLAALCERGGEIAL